MKIRGRRSSIALLIFVILTVRGPTGATEVNAKIYPPPPNFRKPVDYVGFVREQLRFADEDNAASDYAVFFQTESDPPPKPFAPPTALVKRHLEEIVVSPRKWAGPEFRDLQAYLEAVSAYLSAYERGSKHRFFAVPTESLDEPLLHTFFLPHLSNGHLLSKATLAVAWSDEGGFGAERFSERVGIVLRYSGHVLQGLSLLECLTGVRERGMVYTSILAALNQDLIDEASAARITEDLKRYDSLDMRDYLVRAVGFEKALWWDLLQYMSELSGVFKKPRLNKQKTLEMLDFFVFSDMYRSRSFRRKLLGEDPRELSALIESYHSKMMETVKGRFTEDLSAVFDRLQSEHGGAHPYFQVFTMTNLSRSYRECLQTERQRRLTHLALQILLYRVQRGSFPQGLSQLENTPEGETMKDPISERAFLYDVSEHGVRISASQNGEFEAISAEIGANRIPAKRAGDQ